MDTFESLPIFTPESTDVCSFSPITPAIRYGRSSLPIDHPPVDSDTPAGYYGNYCIIS